MRVIYDALLQQKKFRGRYKPRGGDEAEYDFNPYGLVYRNSVIYLVGSIWIYEDPRHYALHRFKKCELMDEVFNLPEDFDLQEYIDSGEFEYVVGSGKDIKLTAIFSAEAAYHLYETPLSEDQKLTKKRDGRIQLTATVKDSQQLRWWLLGFGVSVEVVKPARLRREFQVQAQEMIDRYE
jgi:predicted DNA-binding transcriptional regulator YafY